VWAELPIEASLGERKGACAEMAAKDRYSCEIECPSCGQKGRLEISEDDYPFMNFKNVHRSVDGVEGDFAAVCLAEDNVKVTCGLCSEEFLGLGGYFKDNE